MTKPFDPDDDPAQVAAAKAAAAKSLSEDDLLREDPANLVANPATPRDAATLILYRQTSDGPRILMGCRSEGHDFMPNKYVFPGGRVDDEDAIVPSLTELAEGEDTIVKIGAARATQQQVAGWRTIEDRLRPWDGGWIGVHTGGLGRTDRAGARRRPRRSSTSGWSLQLPQPLCARRVRRRSTTWS